jgi:hypothetical protein
MKLRKPFVDVMKFRYTFKSLDGGHQPLQAESDRDVQKWRTQRFAGEISFCTHIIPCLVVDVLYWELDASDFIT